MKKYKLLKWYPSLPRDWKIGMNVGMGDRNWGYSPTSSIEYDKCLDNKEVENNPEFWEEIIEKDYEIIQFVCTEKRGKEKVGTRLTKQPNGSFWISPEFTEEKC